MIKQKRSIIPALDTVDFAKAESIIREVDSFEKVGGYKLGGLSLVMQHGLSRVAYELRKLTNKPLILDYQKAGNDIPETGALFATICREADIDGVILFPFTGPLTQNAWTDALIAKGLTPIIGGEMTHDKFFNKDGGYIDLFAPEKIYTKAAVSGVRHFVVPGNKPERIRIYKNMLSQVVMNQEFTFYSPGLVTQGGEITEAGKEAGENWHCIVGRAILDAKDPAEAVAKLISQL